MATYSSALTRTVTAGAVALPNGSFNFTIAAGAGTTRLTVPGITTTSITANSTGILVTLETYDTVSGTWVGASADNIADYGPGGPFFGVGAGGLLKMKLTAAGMTHPSIAPRQGGTYGAIVAADAYLPDIILLPNQRVRFQGNMSFGAGTTQLLYFTSVEI